MSDEVAPNGLFISSVTDAIRLSLEQSKILLIYLTDESQISQNFGDKFIMKNPHLRSLLPNFVLLKLIKDTQDYQFFQQVFKVDHIPCLHAIRGNITLDVIYEEEQQDGEETSTLTVDDFNHRIDNFLQSSAAAPAAQQPQSNPQQSSPATPSPSIVSSGQDAKPKKPTSREDKKATAKKYATLKEQSAEIAAQKYREQMMKQQKQAKEERERILRLLEADKEERRRRKAKRSEQDREPADSKQEEEKTKKSEAALKENITRSARTDETDYLLQLKLFNGQSLRQDFNNATKLSDVREFINQKYPEYQMTPYYFFKPIERITYTDEDEISKSLKDLNLNRSLLIIKPSDHYGSVRDFTQGSGTFPNLANQQSSLGWIKSSIGGILGSILGHGRPVNEVVAEATGEGAAETGSSDLSNYSDEVLSHDVSNSTLHNNNNNNNVVPDFQAESQSQYATPVIRSAASTRSSTPRPTLNLSDSTNNFSILAASSNNIPNLYNVADSTTTKKKDEKRVVYNGNDLDLEDETPAHTATTPAATSSSSTSGSSNRLRDEST